MPDVDALLAEGVQALREERLDAAAALLAEVLQSRPEHPDALHYHGILRHAQGASDEGIAQIRRSLELQPLQPGAWNNLGNVYVETQCIDQALAAYQRSVDCAGEGPAAADALNNLGTLHRRAGRWAQAEAACRVAVQRRPDFGDAWYNLSIALLQQGRVHDGLIANSRAVALWPRHLLARDQVLRALLLLGRRDEAAQLYREWLAEEPDNPVVQHQLAACLGDGAPARASDAYVEQVFDAYAKSFDAKLEQLHYRAPEWVAQALGRCVGAPAAALEIVDTGCGTGLCGPLLKPWASRLAGCDLSVGMLGQAQRRGVYDVLHKAELTYYLNTQQASFDAVVSADTLCYFGDLTEVAAAAARALRPGGALVFTVEALQDAAPGEPHRLQPNGRYAHAREHLQAVLSSAGYATPEVQAVVLRSEAGRDVAGWLASAHSGAGAGGA